MASIVINTSYGNGISHEIAHGIIGATGSSFPGTETKAWNCGDGAHIDGNTTVTGPLTGPFKYPQYCKDEEQPIPAKNHYMYEEGVDIWDMKSAVPYVDSNGEIKIRAYDKQTREKASDLVLYMMGLKTKEQASEKDYKLINATCADYIFENNRFLCKSDELVYDEAIVMDASSLADIYGPWGTNGVTSYDPKQIDLGVMFTSDRLHTEAEITHLSRLIRSWKNETTASPSYGESITWSFLTSGLSKIKTDFRDDLLPTLDVERGAITPNEGSDKYYFSADDVTTEAKEFILYHISERNGFTESDASQQYCIARYSATVTPHDGELFIQSINVDDLRILSRANSSTNNWTLGDLSLIHI